MSFLGKAHDHTVDSAELAFVRRAHYWATDVSGLAADGDLRGPGRGGSLVDGAGEPVAGLDDVALDDVALDYDEPDALLPLEHAATPATTVAGATAIITSRFTNFSFG